MKETVLELANADVKPSYEPLTFVEAPLTEELVKAKLESA